MVPDLRDRSSGERTSLKVYIVMHCDKRWHNATQQASHLKRDLNWVLKDECEFTNG